jgi:hypothetical protein
VATSQQLLKVDLQGAKAELGKHVSEIRMVPQVDGKKGHYVAEGDWNLLGGYDAQAGNPATSRKIWLLRGKDLNLRPLGYEWIDLRLSSSKQGTSGTLKSLKEASGRGNGSGMGPENRGKRATDSAPRHFRRLAHRQSSAHLRPADEVIR